MTYTYIIYTKERNIKERKKKIKRKKWRRRMKIRNTQPFYLYYSLRDTTPFLYLDRLTIK